MSLAFDPTRAVILHPGNPEPAVAEAMRRLTPVDLADVIDQLRNGRSEDMTERDAKWRIELGDKIFSARQQEIHERQLHRVRARENNLILDLGDLASPPTDADVEAALNKGKITDVY